MKIKQMRFMTRREWVAQNAEPYKSNEKYLGGVYGCPKSYGFSDGEHNSNCFCICCDECWNKPAIIDGKYVLTSREGAKK